MARTLAFDSITVIKSARSLFWAKGFEAASIPDLEAATGLSRSSIYNSFGSKRGLFDAAVQSYLDEIVRPRLQPLMAERVSASALAEYLDGLITVFSQPEALPTSNGCLLITPPAHRCPPTRTFPSSYRNTAKNWKSPSAEASMQHTPDWSRRCSSAWPRRSPGWLLPPSRWSGLPQRKPAHCWRMLKPSSPARVDRPALRLKRH